MLRNHTYIVHHDHRHFYFLFAIPAADNNYQLDNHFGNGTWHSYTKTVSELRVFKVRNIPD